MAKKETLAGTKKSKNPVLKLKKSMENEEIVGYDAVPNEPIPEIKPVEAVEQPRKIKMAKETPVTQTIRMDDDRLVEFVGKRRLIKDTLYREGKVAVRLDFCNGETRTFTIPDELMQKFAAHGAEQKLGDEIAGTEDIEDCIMAVDELMGRLEKGEWTIRREANGMAGSSILAKALVEHSGKAIEVIKAFLMGKNHAEKVALRGNQAIKPIIERLEAEKAARSKTPGKDKEVIDTDLLLSEL